MKRTIVPLLMATLLSLAGCTPEDNAPSKPAPTATSAAWLCEYVTAPSLWRCASPLDTGPLRERDGWVCHRSRVESRIWVCEHRVASREAPISLPSPHTVRYVPAS